MNNLANVLKKQEKLTEAELMYERTVAIRRKALGASPDTANAMFNLALLYELRLNLADAEVLCAHTCHCGAGTLAFVFG